MGGGGLQYSKKKLDFFGKISSFQRSPGAPLNTLEDKGSGTNLCFPELPLTRNLPTNF